MLTVQAPATSAPVTRRTAAPTGTAAPAPGAELKPSYYRQAVKNVQMAAAGRKDIETSEAFDFDEAEA